LPRVFFRPWYFSSWASGEPHHSGFMSQLVALSLWCVMFLVWQFFVKNLLSVVRVLFPDIFVNFCLQFRWPQWLLVWQSISCSTFSEILYLDFYALISFQLPFELYSYRMVLLLLLLLLLLLMLLCLDHRNFHSFYAVKCHMDADFLLNI
jgi:hypothetical protein